MTTARQMTTTVLTSQRRRQIVAQQYSIALANVTPSMGDRYSGQQIAAAKGIARRRALQIIDSISG